MAAPKPDPEREWRKVLDAHAAHTLHGVITHAAGELIANAAPGPLVDGRPSIDVQGPDGVWRRYLVRLTEAPVHAPLDPAHLRAVRP